jgi:decaprenyl-phosphate phosphoribosyltransferase
MKIHFRDIIHLLRPHQWIKNLLILAPPFFGGAFPLDEDLSLKMVQAFFAFSFASSTGYIINDLLDVKTDRLHSKKKFRPIASARITTSQALVLLLLTFTLSIGFSLRFGRFFILIILVYLILSLAYTFFLQHIVILDAFSIALGFVFRIEAGGEASATEVSSWLFLTTFLLSLLLAFGKRRFELVSLDNSKSFRRVLAKYKTNFLDTALSIFATTAIVTYSLYAVERGPKEFIITVPFVCYGVLRYMYLVQTDTSGDPTETLLKDKWLFVCVFSWIVITALIIYTRYIFRLLGYII